MSGEVALRDMPDAEYAVLDDIRGGITFFPAWKEWLGSQQTVSVKKLYRDPVQLNWGKPCVWLSNMDPRDQMRADINDRTPLSRINAIDNDIAWLEANVTFVHVRESIVRANTE